MRRPMGWLVIMLPFLVVLGLLGLYVLTGQVDHSALPHGQSETSEPRVP